MTGKAISGPAICFLFPGGVGGIKSGGGPMSYGFVSRFALAVAPAPEVNPPEAPDLVNAAGTTGEGTGKPYRVRGIGVGVPLAFVMVEGPLELVPEPEALVTGAGAPAIGFGITFDLDNFTLADIRCTKEATSAPAGQQITSIKLTNVVYDR